MTDKEFFDSFRERAEKALSLFENASVSIGVIKDGEVLMAEGFGKRNIENDLPATKDTLYQIGSCTKAFTGFLCCKLVDEGLLDLDVPIRNYVSDIFFKDEFVTENVTLRDLLSHRTGLPRHEYAWYGTSFTRQELVENVKYFEFSQPFRTKFQYNNFCFIIAGHVCEKVTGLTYEELLQKYVFDPLHMDRTSAYVDLIEKDEDHATPYERTQDEVGHNLEHGITEIPFYKMPKEDLSKGIGAPLAPAGSINSSVTDMLKWVQMYLSKGTVDGKEILSEKMVEETKKSNMILIQPLDMPAPETNLSTYTLGWFADNFRGHKLMQHGGNINGFSAFTSWMPDLNLGVVAYANMNSTFVHYALAREIYDHFLGIDDSNWVTRYHDYVVSRFNALPQMIKMLTGEQVEGTSTSHPLEDYVGVYKRPGYSEFTVTLEDGSLHLEFIGAGNNLSHFHYDTFVTNGIVGELPPGVPVHFHCNELGGVIDSLSMPLVTEAGGQPVVFKKC